MKSRLPKVLHKINGKPMLFYVLETLKKSGIQKIYVVLGFGIEKVKAAVEEWFLESIGQNRLDIQYIHQKEQLGTGHAIMSGKKQISSSDEDVLVMLGDVPFVRENTIKQASDLLSSAADIGAVVISTELKNPNGYGRVLRDSDDSVFAIREDKDATSDEKQIKEINTGIFLFKKEALWDHISKLTNRNAKKEYYLTDMIALLKKAGYRIYALKFSDPQQFMGVNSQEQLGEAKELLYSLNGKSYIKTENVSLESPMLDL